MPFLVDAEWVGEDFMRASIRQFAEAASSGDPARALLTGEDALRQFEIQKHGVSLVSMTQDFGEGAAAEFAETIIAAADGP